MAGKADGSVIIDTRMNTSGFQSGMADMKKGFSGLSSALGKLAKVMVGVFAVKQLVQFGKEAIQLGSDLSEVQNVVDVTFGNLNEEINDFAKNAITQFGLSETAAKQYTSTMGAMLKSMGFTTREAADMSKTMTGLAADMASFYNLDAEEAFAKIRSGISGETEPLKQLGINLNVANLEQYALTQGITKSYNAMTQQEQALLRYNYLLSVTADAQGDFARTSDSWANQTRILAEQFKALKATIGQGLINVFLPVIKVINTLLAKLTTVANAFKAFTELITGKKSSGQTTSSGSGLSGAGLADIGAGYDSAAEGAENYAGATSKAADATKDAAKETSKYVSGLDEIKRYETPEIDVDDSFGGGSLGNAGGIGNAIENVDYGNLAEGETVLDSLSDSMEKLLALFDPLKSAWAEYGDSIKGTLVKIGFDIRDFGKEIGAATYTWFANLDWTPLLASIDELLRKLEPLINTILDGLAWAYEHVLLPIGKWTIEEALPASIDLFSAALGALNEIIEALEPLGMWLWENFLQPIGQWAGEKIIDALTSITNLLTKFGDWVSEHQEIVQNLAILVGSFAAAWLLLNGAITIWNVIGAVATAVTTAFGAAVAFLTSPIGIAIVIIGSLIAIGVLLYKNWDKIKEAAGKLKDWLVEKFTEIKDKVGNIVQSVKDWIVEKFTEIKEKITNITNNIKTTLSNIWTGIKNTASNIFNGAKNNILNTWNLVKTGASAVWSGIKTTLSNIWSGIKNTASNVFSGIQNTISNAWNTVSNIIGNLKNIFNDVKNAASNTVSNIVSFFSNIRLPSIPMPHFSVGTETVSILGKSFSIPSVSVDWYAKGGLFDQPSLIGVGEAGKEAVLPLENRKTMSAIANSIVANLPKPYLASGAVVPPKAQYSTVNIETSRRQEMDDMYSMMKDVLSRLGQTVGNGEKGGTYTFIGQINRRTLFEEMMTEAQLVRDRTGRNPYEMA